MKLNLISISISNYIILFLGLSLIFDVTYYTTYGNSGLPNRGLKVAGKFSLNRIGPNGTIPEKQPTCAKWDNPREVALFKTYILSILSNFIVNAMVFTSEAGLP